MTIYTLGCLRDYRGPTRISIGVQHSDLYLDRRLRAEGFWPAFFRGQQARTLLQCKLSYVLVCRSLPSLEFIESTLARADIEKHGIKLWKKLHIATLLKNGKHNCYATQSAFASLTMCKVSVVAVETMEYFNF